jgi:hypothetical protein
MPSWTFLSVWLVLFIVLKEHLLSLLHVSIAPSRVQNLDRPIKPIIGPKLYTSEIVYYFLVAKKMATAPVRVRGDHDIVRGFGA